MPPLLARRASLESAAAPAKEPADAVMPDTAVVELIQRINYFKATFQTPGWSSSASVKALEAMNLVLAHGMFRVGMSNCAPQQRDDAIQLCVECAFGSFRPADGARDARALAHVLFKAGNFTQKHIRDTALPTEMRSSNNGWKVLQSKQTVTKTPVPFCSERLWRNLLARAVVWQHDMLAAMLTMARQRPELGVLARVHLRGIRYGVTRQVQHYLEVLGDLTTHKNPTPKEKLAPNTVTASDVFEWLGIYSRLWMVTFQEIEQEFADVLEPAPGTYSHGRSYPHPSVHAFAKELDEAELVLCRDKVAVTAGEAVLAGMAIKPVSGSICGMLFVAMLHAQAESRQLYTLLQNSAAELQATQAAQSLNTNNSNRTSGGGSLIGAQGQPGLHDLYGTTSVSRTNDSEQPVHRVSPLRTAPAGPNTVSSVSSNPGSPYAKLDQLTHPHGVPVSNPTHDSTYSQPTYMSQAGAPSPATPPHPHTPHHPHTPQQDGGWRKHWLQSIAQEEEEVEAAALRTGGSSRRQGSRASRDGSLPLTVRQSSGARGDDEHDTGSPFATHAAREQFAREHSAAIDAAAAANVYIPASLPSMGSFTPPQSRQPSVDGGNVFVPAGAHMGSFTPPQSRQPSVDGGNVFVPAGAHMGSNALGSTNLGDAAVAAAASVAHSQSASRQHSRKPSVGTSSPSHQRKPSLSDRQRTVAVSPFAELPPGSDLSQSTWMSTEPLSQSPNGSVRGLSVYLPTPPVGMDLPTSMRSKNSSPAGGKAAGAKPAVPALRVRSDPALKAPLPPRGDEVSDLSARAMALAGTGRAAMWGKKG